MFCLAGEAMGKQSNLVVKSNRLVEAGYRLTLVEQRLILMAIVEARETGKGIDGNDFVRITATEYAQRFEIDESNAYLQLKEARKSLFNRQFTLYQTDKETGHMEIIEARWLSAASYIDRAGTISLQFSQAIVPFITRLEAEFTRYTLEKVAKMTSAYAIRLYELLVQWGSVGRREVELEWLRKILMVENDYPRLFDFKKWVIDVALAQINAHSDLAARYDQRKTGRNVTHLIFTFEPKEPAAPERPGQAAPAVRDSALFGRLRALGIGAKLAEQWIRQDEARALAAAGYVEARARDGLVKGSASGYLRAVFESGAGIGPSGFEQAREAQAREAAEAARRQAEAAKRAEAGRLARQREEAERALAWFQALPDARQAALEAQFLAGANDVDAGLFKKRGRQCTGFRVFLKQAWRNA
jgi:hypothetical protein